MHLFLRRWVLDTHLNVLIDVLGDMFFNSRFDDSDVENERGVIFEEIDMYDDTPDDLASERLFSAVFKGSPLSLPVLGTKKSLAPMTGEFLKELQIRSLLSSKCNHCRFRQF